MPFDFKILVVNQKKPTRLPFQSSIDVVNEINDFDGKRYHTIYPFMTQTNGVWYSLIREDDGVVYASFCSSDYEMDQTNIEVPYWIKDKSYKNDMTPLLIKEKFKDDFEKIVECLIDGSPTKTVMLLARYQSEDHEIICGVISLNEYWSLLTEKKILFNICYIIRKD